MKYIECINFKLTNFFLVCLGVLCTNVVFSQISGKVFKDFNANGTMDSTATFNEVGIDNIAVTAYGVSGTVYGPVTTLGGVYTIPGVNEAARVEFTWTETWLSPSVSGGTTVQLVSGAASNVDLGVLSTDDHWDNVNQPVPKIFVPCYADGSATIGPNIADAAIVTFDNSATGLNITKHEAATHEEVGALYGVAYDKRRERVFSAAFLKRHVGLGPEGIGGVYIFEDGGGGMDLTASFSLQGVTPSNTATVIDLGAVTRVDSPGGNDNYIGSGGASRDMDAYGKVGTVAYGDIDISPDQKLFLVNLHQKTLIVVDVSGTTTSLDNATLVELGAITNTYDMASLSGLPVCTNGAFRPFALKIYNGVGYLGMVCDGANDNRFTNDNVEAFVLSFDPNNITAGFQTAVYFDEYKYRSGPKIWRRWSNTWADTHTGTVGSGSYVAPQPILSDIEFSETGDMIVGFIDRFGHQIGSTNYEPTSGTSNFIEGVAYGDILHVCKNGNSWEIEGTGNCGTNFTGSGSLLNDYSGNDLADIPGTGNGEYYNDAQGDIANNTAQGEASNGAMAKIMGTNLVLSTVMDPFPAMDNGDFTIYGSSGGVHWFNHTSGSWDNHARVYENSNAGFRKSHGLGDLEALLAPPHIEIGNLVWLDTDGDGVQDPNESGINGVTVELVDNSNAVIGTAVTDANGNYIFSNDPDGTSTASFLYNLNFSFGDNVTIRIPNAEGGSQQATLNTYSVSTQDNDGSANGDSRDSDGSAANNSEISVTVGSEGQNNHTFDFGFRTSNCTNPTVTVYVLAASCTNGTPNDDGYFQLSTATDATHYNFVIGSDYSTGDADIANATAFDPATDLPLQFGTLVNPTGSQDYTIRIFNAESDCFTDVTVTLMEQDCTTSCSCEEYIYLNETSNGGAIHKFEVTPGGGSLVPNEIGSPWFDNTALGETVTRPHGLGNDLNGLLYISETQLGNIRRFDCDGNIVPASEYEIPIDGVWNIGSIGNTLYTNARWRDGKPDGIYSFDLCNGEMNGYFCLNGLKGNGDDTGSEHYKDWGLFLQPDGTIYITDSYYDPEINNLWVFDVNTATLNDPTGTMPICIDPILSSDGTFTELVAGEQRLPDTDIWGVTTDMDGNIYIVEAAFGNQSRILKYNNNGVFLKASDYDTETGNTYPGINPATGAAYTTNDRGYFDAIGIVYSETTNQLYVSTVALLDDCVATFDTSLNYIGAAVPFTSEDTESKGLAIQKECCPSPNRQTINQTYCVSGSNDQLFLNDLFPCDGVVCEGQWTPVDATAAAVYNDCDQSISAGIAPGCYSFTKGSDGLENFPKCGAFELNFNLEILQEPSMTLSADTTICAGETRTLSVTTTATDIQWQRSTLSCTTGFANITGATAATYTTAALTDTTYYRTIVNVTGTCSSGSCPFESDCITVNVDPTCATPIYDVSITKTVDNDLPNVNDTITFTLTVMNNNDAVTGASVTDVLPTGLTYANNYTASVGTFDGTVWAIGNMAVGASENITIDVVAVGEGVLNNTATVTINETETDLTNNEDKVCVSLPIEICDDGSQSIDATALDVNGDGTTTYQWYISVDNGATYDSIPANNGGTAQTYNIIQTAYYTYVTNDADLGNCGAQLCCPIIVETTTCVVCPPKNCIPIQVSKIN